MLTSSDPRDREAANISGGWGTVRSAKSACLSHYGPECGPEHHNQLAYYLQEL